MCTHLVPAYQNQLAALCPSSYSSYYVKDATSYIQYLNTFGKMPACPTTTSSLGITSASCHSNPYPFNVVLAIHCHASPTWGGRTDYQRCESSVTDDRRMHGELQYVAHCIRFHSKRSLACEATARATNEHRHKKTQS
jgi:hypothetical protein